MNDEGAFDIRKIETLQKKSMKKVTSFVFFAAQKMLQLKFQQVEIIEKSSIPELSWVLTEEK